MFCCAGVPGVKPGKVVVIGGGVVGFNAAQMAVGLHADVTILDRNPAVLEKLENHFEASAKVVYSTCAALEEEVTNADLVVGAVLIPGAAAPKLVSRELIARMKPGAVVVDVAIEALLHKLGSERTSPFPGRTYPTGSVTGMPRAV